MRFSSRTPASAAWAGTTTASASKWGDDYAPSCSDEDIDCAEVVNFTEEEVNEYCGGKFAETVRKGKSGYWGLGKLFSNIIADICLKDCFYGVNLCRSEVDERPVTPVEKR